MWALKTERAAGIINRWKSFGEVQDAITIRGPPPNDPLHGLSPTRIAVFLALSSIVVILAGLDIAIA